jgi:ribosomal protein S8
MLTVVKSINLINLAAKNQKLSVQIMSNSGILKILRILTDYNLIEYEAIAPHTVKVNIKYKNNSPCLKSIRFMGGNNKQNITCNYAKRELNNKRALYIVQTNKGITSLDRAVQFGEGGTLLFRIKI